MEAKQCKIFGNCNIMILLNLQKCYLDPSFISELNNLIVEKERKKSWLEPFKIFFILRLISLAIFRQNEIFYFHLEVKKKSLLIHFV